MRFRLIIDFSGIKLFQGFEYIGCGMFSNNYLRLDCFVTKQEILLIENVGNIDKHVIGVKRTLSNNKSAYLWHRRLGHS